MTRQVKFSAKRLARADEARARRRAKLTAKMAARRERGEEVAEILRREAPTPEPRIMRDVAVMLAEDSPADPRPATAGVRDAINEGLLLRFRRRPSGPLLWALRSDLLMTRQELLAEIGTGRGMAEALRRVEARDDLPLNERVAAGQVAGRLEADVEWLVELLARKRPGMP